MSLEAWPSPESRRGPLPRIEDLPIREQGYDQEAVRRAFDDFYRHAAQLDASLGALEAVAAFQRDAAQLRADLRALRNVGFGGLEPAWTSSTWVSSERAPSEVPGTVLRIGGEAALLIAVAVVAAVANLQAWAIVALMAAALAVVLLSEWLAGRARTRVPASAYEAVAFSGYGEPAAAPQGEPAPYVEAPALDPAVGWSAFEPADPEVDPFEEVAAPPPGEPLEDTAEDAGPAEDEPAPAEEDAAEEAVAATGAAAGEEEAEPEPSPDGEAGAEKHARGWRRRRRGKGAAAQAEPAAEPEPVPEPPSHVRVLTPGDDEPWERGFDGEPPDR